MNNITKLYPVFLTYSGWLVVPQGSDNEQPTVPETALGGCPKCWSPVLPEEASLSGVCVCCSWRGSVEEVLRQDDLLHHEIDWNTSKYYPGGAIPHTDHWKLARHMHIGGIITQGLLSKNPEKPDWWTTLESMWLTERGTTRDNFNRMVASQSAVRSNRKSQLSQMGFLKHRLDEHEGSAVDIEKIFNPGSYNTLGEVDVKGE